jgi:hypothetical protein
MITAHNAYGTPYVWPKSQRLLEAVFYGVTAKPVITVTGGYQNRKFVYNERSQQLFVNGLNTKLDTKNLVELVYN